MKFGVIENPGSGDRLMLLSVLSVFEELELQPIITPSGNSSISIFHYFVDTRQLYDMPKDPDIKIIGMIRDPRSVLCDEKKWLEFDDWRINLESTDELQSKFDIMWVRYEELIRDPRLMQDAVANFLHYPESRYKKYFNEIHDHYTEIDLPFIDMFADEILINELNYSTTEINKWKHLSDKSYLKSCYLDSPEKFNEYVRLLGYEENDNWALEL